MWQNDFCVWVFFLPSCIMCLEIYADFPERMSHRRWLVRPRPSSLNSKPLSLWALVGWHPPPPPDIGAPPSCTCITPFAPCPLDTDAFVDNERIFDSFSSKPWVSALCLVLLWMFRVKFGWQFVTKTKYSLEQSMKKGNFIQISWMKIVVLWPSARDIIGKRLLENLT